MQEEDTIETGRGGGIDLPYLALGLLRYKTLIAVAGVCGLALSIYDAAQLPDQYVSSGQLFVQGRLQDEATAESVFGNNGGARATTRELVMTELQVLNSPALYNLAAERVGYDRVLTVEPLPSQRGGIRGQLEDAAKSVADWMANQPDRQSRTPSDETKREVASIVIAGRSSFKARGGTSLISVSSTAESPGEAQATTQALLDAAIEVHALTSESMASLKQIEAELQAIEADALAAVQARDAYQRECGIFDFEAQKDSLVSYLTALRQSRDDNAIELKRLEAEFGQLKEERDSLQPVRTVPGSGNYVVNPQVAVLRATLEQVRVRRMDLAIDIARMADSQASLRERRKELDKLESETNKRLATLDEQIAVQSATQEDPRYALVVATMAQINTTMTGLKRKIEGQDQALTETGKRLDALLEAEPRWAILQSRATRTSQSATRLASTVADMRAMKRMQQQNATSLKILQAATLNPICIGPPRTKMVIKGGAFGGVAGVALALLFLVLNTRIKTRRDLVRAGAADEQIYQLPKTTKRPPAWASGLLPDRLQHMAERVVMARKSVDGVKLAEGRHDFAVLPVNSKADTSMQSESLALALSALVGERVLYLSTVPGHESSLWLAADSRPAGGFVDVLEGRCELRDAIGASDVANLDYIHPGTAQSDGDGTPSESEMQRLLESLGEQYRFVVVAAPPLASSPLARSVVGAVDHVHVALRPKVTRLDEVQTFNQAIHSKDPSKIVYWLS